MQAKISIMLYCTASCTGLQNQKNSTEVDARMQERVKQVNAQKSLILTETYHTIVKGTLNTWMGTF